MSIVNVPFAYDIRFQAARSKIEREQTVYDIAPVIVRDVGRDEVKVAITAPLGGGYVDYLSHGGALWEPIPAAGPEGVTPDTPHVHNPFLSRSSPLRVERKERDRIQAVSLLQIREIIRSNRDTALADAQRRADDIILVDGMLYERSLGPVYSVISPRSGRGAGTLVSGSVFDAHVNLGAIFRADQRDEAIEFAEDLFGKPPKIDCDAFIVIDPAVLPDDFADRATRALAEWALRGSTETAEIGLLPNEYLEAYLDYVDATDPANIDLDTLRSYIAIAGTSLEGSKNKGLAAMAGACRIHREYLQRIAPSNGVSP